MHSRPESGSKGRRPLRRRRWRGRGGRGKGASPIQTAGRRMRTRFLTQRSPVRMALPVLTNRLADRFIVQMTTSPNIFSSSAEQFECLLDFHLLKESRDCFEIHVWQPVQLCMKRGAQFIYGLWYAQLVHAIRSFNRRRILRNQTQRNSDLTPNFSRQVVFAQKLSALVFCKMQRACSLLRPFAQCPRRVTDFYDLKKIQTKIVRSGSGKGGHLASR